MEGIQDKQHASFHYGGAKDMSPARFTYRVPLSDRHQEIIGTAERNGQIKQNPTFHLDYNIVSIERQSMKQPEQAEEIQINPSKSFPSVNKEDDDSQFYEPQTYKLRLQFELSDPCQNCHYIPVPQKIYNVRLNDKRQVNLCLGCLLLLTKFSMSRQEEMPCDRYDEPRPKKRKRRTPNSKFVKFPSDQIHSIMAFTPPQQWKQTEYEEYNDWQSWQEDDRRQLRGEYQPAFQSTYLSKLKTLSGMIIVFLVGLYQQIFKG